MSKIRFRGPFSLRLESFLAINRIAIATYARHALGRRMEPTWDADFEIGVRFWRHQFTRAMRAANVAHGRRILDSLLTETDDLYDVAAAPNDRPQGVWFAPERRLSQATLLYCHGGGYSFGSAISERFAAMLAHHCGARLFAPDYRLTPEHPHPAQAEDALAAWRHVTETTPPEKVVVIGDSAGGHMALTLLQNLRAAGLPQPALCIGLCPWTDIGPHGASFRDNDRYDLVQGWMAERFGQWLDPGGRFGRAALSPIDQDYSGLAPIYLQAGGREVLRDMIRDFASAQVGRGAEMLLDVWDDMPHDFQLYDSLKLSSAEAIERIRAAISCYVDHSGRLAPGPRTQFASSPAQFS